MGHKFFTPQEDKIILRCVADNIGNITEGLKQAALKIGKGWLNVKTRYYVHLKPAQAKKVSLRKLIFSNGFFILSKTRIFIQGKNNSKNHTHLWVKKETVKNIVDKADEHE